MSADIAPDPDAGAGLYMVSYGKSGGLGCFAAEPAQGWPRGTQVVVKTLRGLEVGTVLRPASARQVRLLGSATAGRVLRDVIAADADVLQRHHRLGQDLFDHARGLVQDLRLPLEILDVEILFDGNQAVLQYLGAEEGDFLPLVENLETRFALEVRLENLSRAPAENHDEDHHEGGGCGKPDCGKTDGGGGCTSCSTGGGCSSCGSAKVDMKAYFAHLRTRMEEQTQRTPLV